ncbi:MAG: hypothetical protein ACXABO_19425 [Promethearchaeota archaeon]|jgi:hypothetical protein
MSEKSTQQYLSEVIEKIIFDENELNSLKLLIRDLSLGKTEPIKLRKAILNSRVLMMERIVNLFPFYQRQVSNIVERNEGLNSQTIQNLENELEERTKFLEEVGNRVHNIISKAQR